MQKLIELEQILQNNLKEIDEETFSDWVNSPVTQAVANAIEIRAFAVKAAIDDLEPGERFGLRGAIQSGVADGMIEAASMMTEQLNYKTAADED